MARITMNTSFTGHIGRVKFTKGEGETDNAGMLAYFAKFPKRFTVETDEQPAEVPDPGSPAETAEQRSEREALEAEADKNAAENGQNVPATDADAAKQASDGDAEDKDEQSEPKPEPEGDPYDTTVVTLRALCKARGLHVGGDKAELQARLREADEAAKENPGDKSE